MMLKAISNYVADGYVFLNFILARFPRIRLGIHVNRLLGESGL